MKIGEALNKFFTEILGVTADNAELKRILSDSEIANTDIGTDGMLTFAKFFITHEQAKKNPAIERHFTDKLSPEMYSEAAKKFEDVVTLYAKDSGIPKEKVDEITALIRNREKKPSERFTEVFGMLTSLLAKPGDNKAAETEVATLKEQVLTLKREKAALNDEWESKHKAEIGKIQGQMTISEVSNFLKSKYKFRGDIPDFNDSFVRKLEKFSEKYHIAKNETGEGFELRDKRDTSKKAFDDGNGAELDFEKTLLREFGPEWFEKEAGNGDGRRKFQTTIKTPEGEKTLSADAKSHLDEFDKSLAIVKGK